MLKINIQFSLYLELWYTMNAKIKMRQYVISIKPRKFDTADIRCI